jgi:hypothetical protein
MRTEYTEEQNCRSWECILCRCADKSLARPGRKQFTVTEDFEFMYPIYYHNWMNISTVYIYNKTRIKRIFSPGNKIHREVSRAKDLSAHRVGCTS